MNILNQLENKKILILGLGLEGVSTYIYLRKKFPGKVLTLADRLELKELPFVTRTYLKKDKKVKLILGKKYLKDIKANDLIFVSPGISQDVLKKTKGSQIIISTNLELFFELFKGRIIGVTGTKGKSTTSSLIYKVLKLGGKDVILGGNIGEPALSLLDNARQSSIFVLELSSYQLMRLKKSPHISVVQNIAPEHLDYHGSFKKYVVAKENIVKFQSKDDTVIYNSTSDLAVKIAKKSPGKRIPFSQYSKEFETAILPIEKIPLKGRFNLQNVLPAIIIGRMFDIPDQKIAEAIKGFIALEHRLEFVTKVNGVEYYNDSLSTIPESAIAAIESFSGEPKILLLGGYDRGLDFTNLAKVVSSAKIRGVILFPTTGKRIWEKILEEFKERLDLPKHKFVNSMKDAVRQTRIWAEKGDVVLLSPASPSFSGFKDYRDRGDQFKKEVIKSIRWKI